jgi:hypothetical protein
MIFEAGKVLSSQGHSEVRGLVIFTKGISIDEDKVETVWNWRKENKKKNG